MNQSAHTKHYYNTYWSGQEQGVRRARRQARTLERARLAASLLSHSSGSLLEAGCGPGDAASFFAGRGFDVTGIEISPEAAASARSKGVTVLESDIENAPLPEGAWDVILALEVLEHLRDPLSVLETLLEHLADDGELVFSLPNEFHCLRRIAILFGGEPFGGHADPHLRHFGIRSIRRFAEAARVDVCCIKPVTLVPPRFRLLGPAGRLLAALSPALFSISCLVKLRRRT